jgi:hypothetical protein
VFLACVLGAYLLDVFWRERAAWLLVNVCRGKMRSGLYPRDVSCGLEMGSARSWPLNDRVDLPPDAVSTFVQTPCLVMGGVRGETCSG